MEKYSKAVIEVCEFKNEDVIRTSDPLNECDCNVGIAFGSTPGGGGGGR